MRLTPLNSIVFILAAAASIYSSPLSFQQAVQEPNGGGSRPVARAFRATEAPVIDGNLADSIWEQAIPMNGFVQAQPFQGQPASQNTEVRLLFDDTAIFVGVRMHDTDPSQIVTTENRRDAGLNDQDSFQMIFDTFQDR